MTSPEEFYDSLAESYDAMTRFDKRAASLRPVIRKIVQLFPMKSCLDAACGTGLHACLLAEEGVEVTGTDLSEAMLSKARLHAGQQGQSVDFIQAGFSDLNNTVSKTFDAVICLGNSLPHVLGKDQLMDALRNFRACLHPGGVCILGLLNYERVLSQRERIVGAHRSQELEFVRFYDFIDPHIRFNILQLQWNEDQARTELSSTTLHPYTLRELGPLLKAAGLQVRETYGNLRLEGYDPASSSNLVIISEMLV